jgi:hypothetical protein
MTNLSNFKISIEYSKMSLIKKRPYLTYPEPNLTNLTFLNLPVSTSLNLI